MSRKSSVEIGGFEFESDDLEYLMKYKVKKNITEEVEDDILLPEIIHGILVKFPAQCLYQELRLVCKAWQRIISSKNFILENFAGSKPVFLVQREEACRRSYFMEINETKLDYKIREFEFNCLAQIRCSCYGMLLLKPRGSSKGLQVLNSVTGSCLMLPECPSGCQHSWCALELGFDPCTNLFKVVHMYHENFDFEIFTIGDSSNAWKRIPGPWKGSAQRPASLMSSGWSDPVSINGRYLYWDVGSPKHILSMDVSDEKCIKLKLPFTGERYNAYRYQLLELGGQLSFIHTALITLNRKDIYILQDFHSKSWIKKHTIDTEFVKSSLYPLPELTLLSLLVGTSNGVLVFQHLENGRRIYLYDMEKKTMEKFHTKIEVNKVIVHRSSLFKLQQ